MLGLSTAKSPSQFFREGMRKKGFTTNVQGCTTSVTQCGMSPCLGCWEALLSRHHGFAESTYSPAVLERALVAEGVRHVCWVMTVKCSHGMNTSGMSSE